MQPMVIKTTIARCKYTAGDAMSTFHPTEGGFGEGVQE